MNKRDHSKMLESELQRRFISAANAKEHAFARKIVSVGNRGMPDVIYIFDGYVTFIEFKQADGELTPVQEVCHEFLRAAGARVMTLHGWDQTTEFCQREGIRI